MTTKTDHIHRYKKVNIASKEKPYEVYKCQKPLCTHYIPVKLAEGKMCECNICNGMMLITKAVLTHSGGKPMTKPRCLDCIKRKKSDDVAAITDFLNKTPRDTEGS